MGSGWKRDKLKNLSLNITDGTHSTVKNNSEGNYYLLSCKNIKSGKIIISEKDRRIDKSVFDFLRKRTKLEKNDILITTVGTIGEVAIIDIEDINFDLQRSVGIIKPNKEVINPLFLRYFMDSPDYQGQIKGLSRGVAQQCLFLEPLGESEIKYPLDFFIQQKIATILSNYDDLIEKNEKRIKILGNMAKLIYEEWFVKFKFPGHEKVKMVDSETEFGRIPEGWKVKPFSDFCSKITDGTHEVIKPVENGFYMVSATNIKNGFIDFSKTHFISKKDHKKIMLRSKPEKGDILFSKIGTIGNIAVVKQDFEFSIKNIALFKPLSNELSSFIYSYFNNDSNLANFSTKASGTSQKFFSLAFLRNMNLVYPEEKIILNFDKVVYPILEQRHMLNEKNQNLRKTRDLLLPKLISGEIDVSELEIQINLEETKVNV